MTRTAPTAGPTPPLSHFVGRRFAVRSPLLSWLFFERLGGVLAYLCGRAGLRPTAVTLVGGAVGIGGALLLATATDVPDVLLALAVLLLSYLLDCADGQLARATGRTSDLGAWLDVTIDAVVIGFVAVSLCFPLAGESRSVAGLFLAGAYGASRLASLMMSARVSSHPGTGLQLTGMTGVVRLGYVAAIDTPVVYVALCVARLNPDALRIVVIAVIVLTVVQTLVSARNHFAAMAAFTGS